MRITEILIEGVAGPKKCWPNHRKVGTQPGTGKNAGKRVNDCEKIKEDEAAKKGLYYYVNKRKKAGTSRPASSPKAPSAQAWKDAAKTAKKEGVVESSLNEFDPGEDGFGPFKVYVDDDFIEKFSTFDQAKEEIEFLRTADPKSFDADWKIIDGTGKTVWQHDPGEAIDAMRMRRKLQFIKPDEGVEEASLGSVLQWPEVVNKVSSAMKATGWKGKRMSDDAFMFTTRGAEVEDQWYIAIIDNAGEGFFTYALGTVEEGDPHIDDAFKGRLPNTEASISELMNEIRDGFGLD